MAICIQLKHGAAATVVASGTSAAIKRGSVKISRLVQNQATWIRVVRTSLEVIQNMQIVRGIDFEQVWQETSKVSKRQRRNRPESAFNFQDRATGR